MSTQLSNPTTEPYLARVRSELSDIPWLQRQELLATVSERLADLGAGDSPWRELGSPIDFARQLRDGAGLPARRRSPVVRFRAACRRTKIVMLVGIALVMVMIAVAVEWPHYQPLSAIAFQGSTNARRVDDNLATGTDYVVYESGKYVVSGIELRNRGHVPVTVDGVSIATAALRAVGPPGAPRVVGPDDRRALHPGPEDRPCHRSARKGDDPLRGDENAAEGDFLPAR